MRLTTRIIAALLCILASLHIPDELHAQRATSAQFFRTVLVEFGAAKLKDYQFDPKPACPPESRSPACAKHAEGAISEIRSLSPKASKKEGWRFRLSPVRDSAGRKIVDLFLTIDSIQPGFGAVELYRFELSRDGKRVITRQLVSADLVAR